MTRNNHRCLQFMVVLLPLVAVMQESSVLAFAPLLRPPAVATSIPTAIPRLSLSSSPQQEQEEVEGILTSTSSQPELGISIGSQMDFLKSEEDRAALKAELATIIDKAVANGITDLEKLHGKWQRDLEDGNALDRLESKMEQNSAAASKRFNEKVDHLVDSFFNQTHASRQRTHYLAEEDMARQQAEQREQEAKKKRLIEGPKMESWAKTNDAWDMDWDDW